MRSERSHDNHRREVQGDLFSRPGLDETELPRGPTEVGELRDGDRGDERGGRLVGGRGDTRPGPRRAAPPGQPLLPFDRAPSPLPIPPAANVPIGGPASPAPVVPNPPPVGLGRLPPVP